ncbi:MAG: LytTR family transcriptional regulator [Eubacteriaceae bacterium]|nr:LytTR family transcriptional regulator [Eubacteriaceae bacterium]
MVSILRSFDKKLIGNKGGKTHIIDFKDALYFDSVDKTSFIYTMDNVYETALKLYEIEERLSGMGFFRSSKSQIVNIAKISSLCPDFGGRIEVTLQNGEKLIVSRKYAKELKERLNL